MKKTVVSIVLIVVIMLCACSMAANNKANLIIVNRSDVKVGTVTADGKVAKNANDSPLVLDQSVSFEFGNVDSYTFDVAVADVDDRILTLNTFTMTFKEGEKQTLYIVADTNGTVRVTQEP
ncbi:MAG: hypothetical protein RR232_06330 [Clostridia bacterium]